MRMLVLFLVTVQELDMIINFIDDRMGDYIRSQSCESFVRVCKDVYGER